MVKHWLELTLGGVTEEMVKLEALESMLLLFVVTERSSSKMLFKFVRCEYSVKKSKEVSDCCSILWWLEVLLSEINLGKSSRSHSSAATADSWELIKFEPGDSADRDSSAEEVPLPMLPGEVEQLLVGVWLGLERRASRKSCRVGLMRPASRWTRPETFPFKVFMPLLELLVVLERPYPLEVLPPLVLSSSQQSITDW